MTHKTDEEMARRSAIIINNDRRSKTAVFRERLIAAAIQGHCSNPSLEGMTSDQIAEDSIFIADQVLSALGHFTDTRRLDFLLSRLNDLPIARDELVKAGIGDYFSIGREEIDAAMERSK